MAISAKVVAHSATADLSSQLITMEIELHRFVLSEFNTHRVFSRNFQSSRACPIKKLLEQVRTNPAMPVEFGKNQAGMVSGGSLEEELVRNAGVTWRLAAEKAVESAEQMLELGVHKQVTNRLLEPFMWTRGVVTGTKEAFEGFFKLRSHYQAQPEIQMLSLSMETALRKSTPNTLQFGEYHLPYIGKDSKLCIEDAVKVSASCCAQVSYRTLDDSLEKALRIFGLLNLPENGVYKENPPHFSPTEHIAKRINVSRFYSGNFQCSSWSQYRKSLETSHCDFFSKLS